ncbi:uncharacterized protein LOC144700039 isoform X2 [Wolffia australiana]
MSIASLRERSTATEVCGEKEPAVMQSASTGSSSVNRMPGSPYRDEFGNKETNRSASGSHRSSDSGDSFMGRGKLSPMNSVNGSQCSSMSVPAEDGSKGAGPNRRQDRNVDPSKVLLEAAQETIEELRGEARLWERKARMQMAELDALKKENREHARQTEEADRRLRDAHIERNDLRIEIEQLRSSMEGVHQEEQIHKQKELEEELKFLRESNASLSMQLKKTQESNIELVSILQELEENNEKQQQEIACFSEKSSSPDLERENFHLKGKIQELERECAEHTQENLGLVIKMKEQKTDEVSIGCTPQIFLGKFSSSDPGSEIFQHMAKAHLTGVNSGDKESEHSVLQFKELEKKCAGLELELEKLKDTASVLTDETELQKKNLELSDLMKTLKMDQQENKPEIDRRASHGHKLVEYLGVALVDLNISSICLEDMEKSKDELEFHVSDLEEENVGLLERITGLENQLRNLMNTNESSRLELEKFRNLVLQLRGEIQKMAAGMEKERGEQQEDKLKLESSLREAQSKVKLLEKQIENVRQELGSNIQSLIGLLNASKESEDMLMADIGRMKMQIEKMRSGEEKIKELAEELQLKLKSSDFEKQQLTEEVSNLQAQLTKITQLQDEITALNSFLEETNLEKAKLEQSLEMMTEEREKLKLEMESRSKKAEHSSSENENDLQKTISSLQTELSAAVEANNAYKDQIKRFLAEKEASPGVGRTDRLEIELKEMRDRYLQMSLRYAEVEAQREDLVMKLKTTKKEKNWFS